MPKCMGMMRRIAAGTSQFTDHPCGMCLNCKINLALEYATKVIWECFYAFKRGEGKMWFNTFTLDDEKLESFGMNLYCFDYKVEMRKFQQRFRIAAKRKWPHLNINLRVAYNFEYGGKNGRPHWHSILFGFPGTELELFEMMLKHWPYGKVDISEVRNWADVGRYITKHITNFAPEKGDSTAIGCSPYRVSPNHMGREYVEKFKAWHQATLERYYTPDPTEGGKGKLRIPREWIDLLFTPSQKIRIKSRLIQEEDIRYQKLTPEEQRNETTQVYEKAFHSYAMAEKKRQFFKPAPEL